MSRVQHDFRRRDFLRFGTGALIGWTVHTAMATRIARAAGSTPPLPTEAGVPVALSPRRYATVVALVEALYPGRDGLPPGVPIGVPQRIDEEIHFALPRIRGQIELALDILEFGGPLLGWWWRFSRLERERRERGFVELFDHPLESVRQVATALSQLVQVFYYANEAVWPAIGYDGPWMPRKPPESSAYYAELVAARRREVGG